MADEDVIESPEVATAGLTSALQLVDRTSVPATWLGSATSVAPLVHIRIPMIRERSIGFGPLTIRPISRAERLQQAIQDSVGENLGALEELSRY